MKLVHARVNPARVSARQGGMDILRLRVSVPVVPVTERVHDGRMKRLALAAAIAVALPLLTACSPGGAAPGGSGEPATGPTAVHPTIDIEGGDRFCDLAVEQIDVASEVEAKSNEVQALLPQLITGGGLDELHQWGEDMANLSYDVIAFYDEVTPMVDDAAAQESFVKMRAFVNDYTLALAVLAQGAESPSGFVADMAAFTQDPGVQATLTAGPEAALEVRAYIDARCG